MLRHPKAFERIAFFFQFNDTCKILWEQAEMKISEFAYLKSVKEIIKNLTVYIDWETLPEN